MQAIFGVLYHIIGGVGAGSFYMPLKKVKGWHWESYWMLGGLFSWIIVPLIAAYLSCPQFFEIIIQNGHLTPYIIMFGLLWGIGGLTYGLGMRYLGISLGNSVILGITMSFGSLLPAIYYDFFQSDGKETLTHLLSNPSGRVTLLGILVCIIGIGISGRAGILKEKSNNQSPENKEFSIKKGLILAAISGLLSACFNYGIEAGKPLALETLKYGTNPLLQNNIIFVVILWGGFTTNFIWCTYLSLKNKSYRDYSNKNTPLFRNTIFSAIAGIMWFLQFFFYGMGESEMGNGASSWMLHMSSIILVGNFWGIVLKEWKGVNAKAKKTMILSVVVLLLSVIIVGYGTSLK